MAAKKRKGMRKAGEAPGPIAPPAMQTAEMPALLLAWYDRHGRVLPWRILPGATRGGHSTQERPDPYRVWLSEVMLQQTTVATVKGYFERFLARWPGIQDLAAAALDDVLHAWAGLGYYARARNLHRCAQIVARDFGGVFPESEAALLRLPGIGAYTAAAIAAIAFDARATILDGNVERVIARLYRVETPLPKAKPRLRALAEKLTPAARPGDYAQAIMDLGATICTPRKPACPLCPWRAACQAAQAGVSESLPRRLPKAARPIRHGYAYLMTDKAGAVFLQRRPERGLLGGMMEVPSTEWRIKPWSMKEAAAAAPARAEWRALAGEVRHVFTHFELRLKLLVGQPARLPRAMIAVAPDRLSEQALPSVMHKVLRLGFAG